MSTRPASKNPSRRTAAAAGKPSRTHPPGSSRPAAWAGLCLVAVTVGVYWQVRDHEFVYDDLQYVVENLQVQRGFTPESLRWSMTSGHAANWHPLTWLSHMLDCRLYGLKPAGHHLTSLLLHVLNTLILLFLLTRLTGSPWRSAFVAAVFALHPLHVESVAWVAERKDVLSTFFGLLALAAYVRHVERPGARRYALVLVLFAASLLAKPMLVTLPFVLLLVDYWPLGRFAGRWHGRLATEKLPLLALSAASSVVTYLVQQQAGVMRTLEHLSLWSRLSNAPLAYLRYIGKAFLPVNLAVFYPHPRDSVPAWQALGALLILAGASALAIRTAPRRPYLAVGWLWFLGTLVPVIGLVQVGEQALADRYTYVPLIGVSIVLAWGIPELVAVRRPRLGHGVLGAAAVLGLASLGCLTWTQVGRWRDAPTLFTHALRATADNYVAHNNLGAALDGRGRSAEALAHFKEAVRIRPGYLQGLNNMGGAYYKMGRHREAAEVYDRSLRIDPDNPQALVNLSAIRGVQGRHREAVDLCRRALRGQPGYAAAHYNLATNYYQMGRLQEAADAYAEAVRLKPNDAEMRTSLGSALYRMGKPDEAIRHHAEALRLNPGSAAAHSHLGAAYAKLGRLEEAAAAYREAVRLGPNDAGSHAGLAAALARIGRFDEAVARYSEALRIEPNMVQALNNLAWIRATHASARLRDASEAIRLATAACARTRYGNATFLDTLAAAYAEAGRFGDAVRTATRALELARSGGQGEADADVAHRLGLYRAGRAFREPDAGRQ